MSLREELSDRTYERIREDPAGRVFLDGGAEALTAGGFGMPDLLRLLNLTLSVHNAHILRLADEIDALKRSS